jgi:hypothetical protein
VRIGLNLKGLAYATCVRWTWSPASTRSRPIAPSTPRPWCRRWRSTAGRKLTQSLAILEWLDETVPEPRLLPADPFDRATVRTMAEIIACDIHPVNNLRILRALTGLGVDETAATPGISAGSPTASRPWSR